MFKLLKKKNHWESIGGVLGFHQALETLGSEWRMLHDRKQGYAEPGSIWDKLACNTNLEDKESVNSRKWLFTVWKEDRKQVRTKFYEQKVTEGFLQVSSTISSNRTTIEHRLEVILLTFYLSTT